MSTPSFTKTFVTGDRVRYVNPLSGSSKAYHGTIIEASNKLNNWYVLTLEEYPDDQRFVLPGTGMTLIPSVEEEPDPALEMRYLEAVAIELSETMEEWKDFMKDNRQFAHLKPEGVPETEEAFDQGYLSGLRRAIQIVNTINLQFIKDADK